MKKKIFLSFDFYGSGNIGDDIMLEGFIKGMGNEIFEYYCYVPESRKHIKKRFRGINFVTKEEKEVTERSCPVWIGAGDTPVQVKSGDWFLKKLNADREILKQTGARYFFAGIGAEAEAEVKKELFLEILNDAEHIWTRDKMTYDFLKEVIGVNQEKVSLSSDLANIFLHDELGGISKNYDERKYDIGICYYDENASSSNIFELKKFLKKNFKRYRSLLICNDINVRGNFEYSGYVKMFSRMEKLFRRDIKICLPEYFTEEDTGKLISHFTDCRLVMSSRYHVLLTAAWAGCKVISMERSSKVTALSKELNIFEIKKPFTAEKLNESISKASIVDRDLLLDLYKKSINGVKELSNIISK